MREAASIVRRIVGPLPVRVFLFGSRALGTGRPTSDIDLALLSDDPLPADPVVRLKDEFEESTIPYTVDVIDLSQVDEPLREKVLREGREWPD
jgi:predicted nucleotidyltransferase